MNFFQSHQKHWRSVTNRFIPRYNYLIFYLTNDMLKSTTSLSTCLAMFLVIFLLLYSIAAAVAFLNDLLRFALVTVVLRSGLYSGAGVLHGRVYRGHSPPCCSMLMSPASADPRFFSRFVTDLQYFWWN